MRTKIIAKAVVFNEHGQVLLLTRSKTDDRRPGEQDFPGGGVEPGEDFTAAVRREIYEEAGLKVSQTDVHLFQTKTEIYKGTNIIRLLFWAKVSGQEVRLSFEHDDYHYVQPSDVFKEFPHPFYGLGIEYGLKHNVFNIPL